ASTRSARRSGSTRSSSTCAASSTVESAAPGRAHRIGRARARSMNLDLDRARLLRLRLRQMDLEHAVAAFRRDLVDIDIVRQREASRELAVERFAPMLPLVVGRLLDAPLAAQRQHAVLDADIDVFLLDLGQIGLDRVLVVGLDDIRRRTPLQPVAGEARTQPRKLADIPIEEVFELPKRTPGDQVHVSPSYV